MRATLRRTTHLYRNTPPSPSPYQSAPLSRLVTCEADKSIKIWRENKQASPESHPVDLAGWTRESLAIKVH